MAKVFFAWVDDLYEPFDPAVHGIIAEGEFSLIRLSQRENAAATGEITFANPGVGLLSASRRRFVLISESETDDPSDAVLVARGRIFGMPTDFRADQVTTQIICAPDDFDEKLADAAEALFGTPWCDLLFGDEPRDTAAALAARGASWHIDPRTHEITITDVLGGGPVVDIGHAHAGDFSIRMTEPPLRGIKQTLDIDWEQSASGTFDAASRMDEFGTMSPEPEVEITTGAGYDLGENYYRVLDESTVQIKRGYQLKRKFKQYTYSHSVLAGSINNGQTPIYRHYWAQSDFEGLEDRLDNATVRTLEFERLLVSYRYSQARRERVELEVMMPMQDVMGAVTVEDLGVTTLADPTVDTITPVWYPGMELEAGDFVQHDGKRWVATEDGSPDTFYYRSYLNGRLVSVTTPGFEAADSIAPMPDSRAPSFVGTPRGDAAIAHALLLMRARLRYRLRCLEATVRPNDWLVLRDISMAHSLRADHAQFGQVEGKVIEWNRAWLGGNGGRAGTITIGASLGNGTTGSGSVEDLHVATAAQTVAVPVNAYALSLPSYAVTRVVVANDAEDQMQLGANEVAAGRDPTNALATAMTRVHVELRPLTTVSTIERKISVTAVCLDSPQGYDAGAN